MRDISFQGATLTLKGPDGIGSVTIRDLSDEGTPISFGNVNPIRTSKTMHGIMLAWHAQVTPEFSLSPIPGSDSDRKLRALLLSCIVRPTGEIRPLADVFLEEAVLVLPTNRNSDGVTSSQTFVFKGGFLVGGSSAIGANGEGRQQTAPYQFQWEDVTPPEQGNEGNSQGGRTLAGASSAQTPLVAPL